MVEVKRNIFFEIVLYIVAFMKKSHSARTPVQIYSNNKGVDQSAHPGSYLISVIFKPNAKQTGLSLNL